MSSDESSVGVPGWLAASGFAPAGDDVDWDALAEQLAVDVLFDSAVEMATRVLDGPDPWADRSVGSETLSDDQRRSLTD
ncbi:MAG: hypothetical protein Q7V57_14230 [Actinomycetota bacterium]|nr:hypothetical protein [Actinomycetota bacterium]